MWQILFEDANLTHPLPLPKPRQVRGGGNGGRRPAVLGAEAGLVPPAGHTTLACGHQGAPRSLPSELMRINSPLASSLRSSPWLLQQLGPAEIFWTIGATIPNYWPRFLG